MRKGVLALMKRLSVISIVCVLMFSCFVFVSPTFAETSGVVQVLGEQMGLGFIISPNGYILSHQQVVGELDELNLLAGEDLQVKASVKARDDKSSLVLLKADLHHSPIIGIDSNFKVRSQQLVQLVDESLTLVRAEIIQDELIRGDRKLFTLDSNIDATAILGSPVFNENGHLVGVVDSQLIGTEIQATLSEDVVMFLGEYPQIEYSLSTLTESQVGTTTSFQFWPLPLWSWIILVVLLIFLAMILVKKSRSRKKKDVDNNFEIIIRNDEWN